METMYRRGATPKFFRAVLVAVIVGIWTIQPTDLLAQRPDGANTGIGLQLGQPSGLTLKHYTEFGRAFDFAVAWDLNEFVFTQGHYLFENHFAGSEQLHYFIGPGAFLGLDQEDDEVRMGLSGNLGMTLVFQRLEFYGQITPQVGLVPATDTRIGAGAGLRYYF